jgi:hypothetical protein
MTEYILPEHLDVNVEFLVIHASPYISHSY